VGGDMPKLIPVKIASQKFELATDNALRFTLLFNIVATAENMLRIFYIIFFNLILLMRRYVTIINF